MKRQNDPGSLRIALLGHGRMGTVVERMARQRGLEVALVVGSAACSRDLDAEGLADVDVCIDFTTPDAVVDNVRTVVSAGTAMVVGTTGWYDHLDQVRELVLDAGTGFVYGPNFSLGMNATFALAERAAELFSRIDDFEPFLEEAHHERKVDAPSGTALALREILEAAWPDHDIPTAATRAGHIPGTHRIGFDAPDETVVVEHVARGREAFAAGALFAAEWVMGRSGFYHFRDLLR